MNQGRSCSQNRLTSTGGPTRASGPGVFPFVSGHRAGTSWPGGGHRAQPRPHSSQQEEKERRPGEAGQLAGRESRAPALGTGEPPLSPPRLRVRGVGWGKRPPGLRALSKVRPLLRARSCPKWVRGARASGEAQTLSGGPGEAEWLDPRGRPAEAGPRRGRAYVGAGPGRGRAETGAGTWVRSHRPAPLHFRVPLRGSGRRRTWDLLSDPRRSPAAPRPRWCLTGRRARLGLARTDPSPGALPRAAPRAGPQPPRPLAPGPAPGGLPGTGPGEGTGLLLVVVVWQWWQQQPGLEAKGIWEPQPHCRP